MSKVKTYLGRTVPDGATCFVEPCGAFKAHFGKEVDGIEYVFVLDHKYPEWNEISNILPLKARGAIELPEEEAKPDSRIDAIGQNGNDGEHYEDLERNKSKYHREIKSGVFVDTYDVLMAFEVTNPAMQHALKKMLAPGQRGVKDTIQDMKEAIQSIERAIELEQS